MKWLSAVLTVAGFLYLSSPVAAQGCPANSEPYKEERSGETTIIRCRCVAGYVTYHQTCRPKPDVEALLIARAQDASKGAKHTAESIRYEAAALGLAKLHDQALSVMSSAGVAYLAKSPSAAIPAVAQAIFDISTVLFDVGGCSANDAIRTGCDNLRNFQKILTETEADLKRLEQAP